MFVGHYGASFVAKSLEKRIPLLWLFIAVQLVDIVWAVLVLLGIEKVRIIPGITATNPLDLYYMPYTHSLLAAVVWSGAAFAAYRSGLRPRSSAAALLVAACVFSHWVLDLVVHRPDLPLYDDASKVGLGLWNRPILAFGLEAALLFAGLLVYFHRTRPVALSGRSAMPLFGVVMLVVQASVFFGPPPPSPAAVAVMALVSYLVFAAVAAWLDGKRA